MPNLRRLIETRSSALTMYKGLLFGLLAIIGVGLVFALTGLISISAGGLVLMVLVLGVSSYLANRLFAAIWKLPPNSESWLISALIITCIVAPSTDPGQLLWAAVAGVVAMASKYLLAFRGSVILNPAAVGAFVVSVTDQLPAIWWIATPYMLFVTVPVALITLYKHRKFQLFAVFFIAATAVLFGINATTQQEPLLTVLGYAVYSWPLIFLGSIMLTEPNTLPAARYLQLMYALIVGLLTTAQLQYGPLATSPLLALLVGNLFIAFVMPPWGGRLRLLERNQLAGDIQEFIFGKPKNLAFAAGQYLDVTVGHRKTDFKGNRRSFSLASAPSEDTVRITTRIADDKPSSFKRALDGIDIDDKLRMGSLRGEFLLPSKPETKLLLIAGGIGITPFRSQIVEMTKQGTKRDAELIYIDSAGEHIYLPELKAAKKIGLKAALLKNRLTAEEIKAAVPDLTERQVYISGPPAMVFGYYDVLRQAGAKRRNIHTDSFNGY